MSSPLIITGMHRSGTSLIAKFIHGSGIDLGNSLVGANKGNRYGHFEDAGILEFHRNILIREFGSHMWGSGQPRITNEDRAQAVDLISQRQHKQHWGWKEPRTCLFLDFWKSLLPGARFLFIVRNPISVVDSLVRREKHIRWDFRINNNFLRSWLVYNRQCQIFYEQNKSQCMMVILEHALHNSESFINMLSKHLAFEFNVKVFNSTYDRTALKERSEIGYLVTSPILRLRSALLYKQLREKAGV